MIEKPALLRPTLDVVFKMLFARKRGHGALIGLLNAILKPASKITSVEVQNPHIPKLLIDDKGTILDIHVKLDDGTLLDIEMQMAPHESLAKRALYYASRMYATELGAGDFYSLLRPVIVIFLLAEDLFPARPDEFAVGFSLHQDDDGPAVFKAELSGQMQIKFYEIGKAFRLWQTRQLPPDDVSLGAWLGFLADPSSQSVEEACMSIPELKDAKVALEELSAEDEAREIARIREKSRLHWDSLMDEARRKGKAEGKEDASLAFLKALLTAPETNKLPDAKVAELTGLPLDVVIKFRAETK